MHSSKTRKYTQYKALECALRRDKYSRPGALSSQLLTAFLEQNGEILSESFIGSQLCEKGQFSSLRRRLIQDGWLIWNPHQQYKAIYFAGKKLIKYINREKLLSQEVVIKSEIIPKAILELELSQTKTRLNNVENRLTKLEKTVENGIEKYLAKNPPDTPERRHRVRKNFEETGELRLN